MTGVPMNIFVVLFLCLLLMVVSSKNAETIPPPNADIICPDGLSICPATSTCCISTDGDYSCCPIQDGVCCADHKHCCPKHYKCDLKIFKCDRVFSATMLGMEAPLNKN